MKLLTATGVALFLSSLLAVVWIYSGNPSDFDGNLSDPLVLLVVFGTLILGFVSLGLARVQIPRLRVRVIAAAFLIVALSVPAAFFYAAESPPQVGCLCVGGTGPQSLTVTGSIVVPSGTGTGNLTIEVRNANPVDNASVIAVGFTDLGLTNGRIISNVGNFELMYHGILVSPANPLPIGTSATGSLEIPDLKAGLTYQVQVDGAFQNGGTQVEVIVMTAQF